RKQPLHRARLNVEGLERKEAPTPIDIAAMLPPPIADLTVPAETRTYEAPAVQHVANAWMQAMADSVNEACRTTLPWRTGFSARPQVLFQSGGITFYSSESDDPSLTESDTPDIPPDLSLLQSILEDPLADPFAAGFGAPQRA